MTTLATLPAPGPTRRASVLAHPVTLADGQTWGLARPARRYRPEVVPSADVFGRIAPTVRLVVRTGYPWRIEHLVTELHSACRAGRDAAGDQRRYEALLDLAVALLRRAHDLTLAEAITLLDLDSAGLACLVDSVVAAVAGVPADSSPGANLDLTGDGDAFP